ncbi:hypothetical protein ACGFZU_35040 [Streptomyces tendae]|uniref:hypothetical protein n=1 Tax=Streptomyces tendae TaxID=1932 RepID=UPI00371D8DBC
MNDPLAEVDPAAGIRVQITDLKSSADALYFEDENGEPVLLIRRVQSFPSAVEGVRDALEIPEEQARAIVRFHHPEAAAWGEQNASELIAVPPARPVRPARKQQPPTESSDRPARHLRLLPRWTVTAIAAVAALGAGYTMAGKQAVPQTTPDAAGGIELADAQPYASAAFKDFATDGEMACTPTGPLEAKCVDVDGKVMYSEASVGSDWTQFSFTYDEGANRIGLRVFSNEAAAKLWVHAEGMQESVHNLVQYDRYALWGNDKKRLGEYLDLLRDENEPSAALETAGPGRHAGQPEHITVAAAKQARPKVQRPKHAKPSAAPTSMTLTSPSTRPGRTTAGGQAPAMTPAGVGTPSGIRPSQHARHSAHQQTEQAAPMPRRLAVLALGTLGVDPADPPTLAEANTLQEMGTLVAISMVMGVDPDDTGVPVEEIPVLDLGDAVIGVSEPSTVVVSKRSDALLDEDCTAPEFMPVAKRAVAPATSPAPERPTGPPVEPQKPVKEKQPVKEKPTTPTTPQPPKPSKPAEPEKPVVSPPTTETPSTETPAPGLPDTSELDIAAPVEKPVLEDPVAEPEESADEDQAQDVYEGRDDTAVPPPEDGDAPATETDAGADLVLIPEAWRGDQAS